MSRLKKISRISYFLVILFTLFFSRNALAATATTTFSVTATVATVCSVSTVPALNFGTYNPTNGANDDATTNFTVTCTDTSPYNVGLDKGTTSGGTIAIRKMKDGPGTHTIDYTLYSDSARSVVWGDVIGTNTVANTGTGVAQPYTVYGRIPIPQSNPTIPPTSYSDTITLTVTY